MFGAAPEKYHTLLNVTADIKGKDLDIDDIERSWIIYGIKVEVNQVLTTRTMNWSLLHLLELAMYARIKATRLLNVPARIREVVEMEVINSKCTYVSTW
jgi:hypothetical protein